VGSVKFGTRTEIKNLNSFKFVERALEYEIARQQALLRSGQEVVQETLLFDSATGVTKSMRGKEESADYRYFPDPDLPPIVVDPSWIEGVRQRMPELPYALEKRLVTEYGLSEYDAEVLTGDRSTADFFREVVAHCNNPKAASNWLTTELFGALKKLGLELHESPVSAKNLGKLVALIDDGTISGKMAKQIF
jgi:aspartyl-tRNA(Asn)/glutamyl-tRNA(Gln) amidotransferase subunit B